MKRRYAGFATAAALWLSCGTTVVLLASALAAGQELPMDRAAGADWDGVPYVLASCPGGAKGITYPDSYEQFLAELVNRAREFPLGEVVRYGTALNEGLAPYTISCRPKQPLAVNPYLVDAARGHSVWMIANRIFSHTGAGGSDPGDRMAASGYVFIPSWGWGENIALYQQWPTAPEMAWATAHLHEALYVDDGYPGRGHRSSQLDPDFMEIGTGVASGTWPDNVHVWNAVDCTEDFAYLAGDAFITGVAYDDTVEDDDFYTPGEGLGGVTVTATRQSDLQQFVTTTWASGGYSLQVPPGTYTVAATGGGLGGTVTCTNVVVGSQNVKRDFTPDMVSNIAISVELDPCWAYQNTSLTLANGGHRIRLEGTILNPMGNTSFVTTVAKIAGSGDGAVTVEDDPLGDPLVKYVVGSMRSDGTAGTGVLMLEVTVAGNVVGHAVARAPVAVRPLGDIDDNGAPEPGDVSTLILKLNGVPPAGYPDAAFDLDANGAAEPTDVQILINILNGLPIP